MRCYHLSLGKALLGLLDHRPMTGYDLKKILDHPTEKRPDRKVYQITKEGQETFLNWLNKFPVQLSQTCRSQFLIGIFFSSRIKLEELAFEIKRYKKEIEEQLRYLNKVEQWIKDYSREKKFKEDAFY